MSPKYRGCAYLIFILHVTTEKPEYIYQLTTKIYPMVMKRFQAGKSSVERNIRFAIKRTWEDGNKDTILKIFGPKYAKWPPTNSEFISILTAQMGSLSGLDYQIRMNV